MNLGVVECVMVSRLVVMIVVVVMVIVGMVVGVAVVWGDILVVELRENFTPLAVFFFCLSKVCWAISWTFSFGVSCLLLRFQLLPTSLHLVVEFPGPGTGSLAGWEPVRSSVGSVLFS